MKNPSADKSQTERKIDQELWNRLSSQDPAEVCHRSLADYNEAKRAFKLKILNKDYSISMKNRTIHPEEDPSLPSVEFYLQVAAVNYLTTAKDIPLDGRWVSEQEFPNGPIFFRGPHALPSLRLEETFGRDAKAFALASESCGGKSTGAGDAAFDLPVFPRLSVRIILWLTDEEFPARVSFLFDRTANIHLQLDGLYAVGKVIESEMLKAASR
jgi:hypothetical protein